MAGQAVDTMEVAEIVSLDKQPLKDAADAKEQDQGSKVFLDQGSQSFKMDSLSPGKENLKSPENATGTAGGHGEMLQSISTINVKVTNIIQHQQQAQMNDDYLVQSQQVPKKDDTQRQQMPSQGSSLKQQESQSQLESSHPSYYQLRPGKQIDLQILGQQAKQSSRSPKRQSRSRDNNTSVNQEGSFIVGHGSVNNKATMMIREQHRGSNFQSRKTSANKYNSANPNPNIFLMMMEPQQVTNPQNAKFQSLRVEGGKISGSVSAYGAPDHSQGLKNSKQTSLKHQVMNFASNTNNQRHHGNIRNANKPHIQQDSLSQTPKFEEFFSPMSAISSAAQERNSSVGRNHHGGDGNQSFLPHQLHQRMFESPKSGLSGSSEGDIVPSIAVSRKYINSSQQDEGNIQIDHSYQSSIKNVNERNSQRQNSSISQRENNGEKQHLTTGAESFDLREKYPETASMTFENNPFYLQPTLNQPSGGGHIRSVSMAPSIQLDRPVGTNSLMIQAPPDSDLIILPKGVINSSSQARVSYLYVKEGDYIYEINARDLIHFQKGLQKSRKEHLDAKAASKVAGVYKQFQKKKQMGHMVPNLRPNSQNSILMRIEEKESYLENERLFLSEFLGMLKYKNKARLYRPDKNQKSFKPFTKEVLYKSKVDESLLLQLSTQAGFSDRPSCIVNQSALGESISMNWHPLADPRPPSEIIGGAQSLSHSQDISHKTICKSVIAPTSQEIRSNSPDLNTIGSRIIALSRPQSHLQESAKNHAASIRPVSQGDVSSIGHQRDGQENRGDTRNIIIHKTASSTGKEHKKKAHRSQADNFKIDTRRSGSSGVENVSHIKPLSQLMSIPAVRKLINFKKLNSPGRHARQASQISSFIESNIDNIRDNMKPLINEDLDFPEVPSQSLVGISARQLNSELNQDTFPVDPAVTLNQPSSTIPGDRTLSQSQKFMRPVSPTFMNGQISTVMQETINYQGSLGQSQGLRSPSALQGGGGPLGVECQTSLTYTDAAFKPKPWKPLSFDGSQPAVVPYNHMKTVRVQEFKIELEGGASAMKEDMGRDPREEALGGGYNSSQKGTKFSNSHIKMHINQMSIMSNKEASPSLGGNAAKSGRQSPMLSDFQNQEKYRRAQSLKKNHINQNFRMNSSHVAKTLEDQKVAQLNIADPKSLTSKIQDLRKNREAGTGMNLSKVYYDTPQFGFSKPPTEANFYDFGGKTDSLYIPEDELAEVENGGKKNILLSKKQATSPKSDQHIVSQLHQSPNEFSPGKDPQIIPSVPDMLMDREYVEAQMTDIQVDNIQNLEHIIEETCESVDSMGRVESTHTMKSNFAHMMSLPSNEVKRKRSHLRVTNSHHNQSQYPVVEATEVIALSTHRSRSKSKDNAELNKSQDIQDASNNTPGRHRVVHSKRSIITPVEKQLLHANHDQFRRASSNQLESHFERSITPIPNDLPESRHHGSTGSLHTLQKIAQNFSLDNNEYVHQQSPLDKSLKIVSKLVISNQNPQFDLNIHEGRRAQRSQTLEGMLSAGNTRGSYHHVSSKGEFDAPPRYNHNHESNPVIAGDHYLIKTEQHSQKKGQKHETKIPGVTKYQKIELPMVEQIASGNTPQTNALGTSFHPQNQMHFNQNSQVQIKLEDPLSHMTDDLAHILPGFSGDLLSDLASAMPKPRLVLKKHGLNGHQNKGMDTTDHSKKSKTRGNYALGKVIQMVSEIPSSDRMLASERKEHISPKDHYESRGNQIDRLDPKQAQMIRRNISVYRRANRKLKEIQREKQELRSRRENLKNQSQLVESKVKYPQNKSVLVQESKSIIDDEMGDRVYDQFINSQLPHTINHNLQVKLKILQSRTPIVDVNSDLHSRIRQQGVFTEHVSPNDHKRPLQSNMQLDRKITAESGIVLKHDDSSTIRDEQSLYTPGLIHPKILSSNNLTNNAASNLQIITNQGYSRMANNSSKSKIQLPKTVVVSQTPLDAIQHQSHMHSQLRVGSSLTTERVGSYIKQIMQNMNHNLDSLGRGSYDVKAINAELNHFSGQQSLTISRPGSSTGAYKQIQMNTINAGAIPIHVNYQSSAMGQHRRLKSSFTGRSLSNQGPPFTAFGRGLTSAGSTQRQTELSKGVMSNPSTGYGSRPKSNLNGLVVSSMGFNFSGQPKANVSPVKVAAFGDLQKSQVQPFGTIQGNQARPGTTSAFNYQRPSFNLQLN